MGWYDPQKFGALKKDDSSIFENAILNRPDCHSVSDCPTFPRIGKLRKTREMRHLWSCWPTAEEVKRALGFRPKLEQRQDFPKVPLRHFHATGSEPTWIDYLIGWKNLNQRKIAATQFADRSPDPMVHLGSPETWSKWRLTKIQKISSNQVQYLGKRDEHFYKQVPFPRRLQHWAFDFWLLHTHTSSPTGVGDGLQSRALKGLSIHRKEMKRTSSMWKKTLHIICIKTQQH